MKRHYFFVLFTAILFVSCQQPLKKIDSISIIPKPMMVNENEGVFILDKNTDFKINKEFSSVGNYFQEYLKENIGYQLDFRNRQNRIEIKQELSIDNPEGYELIVKDYLIQIKAKTEKGAFYGIQSLLQLFPISIKENNSFEIPNIEIKDKPQFKYRGMHLDLGRHFYSVDFIKKYIDLMSRLKINKFHWHLTEDQGWRIEIKKYPKLQEIAAYRKETLIGHYSDQPHQFDGKIYGGFYTQEQIKDIVDYAELRQITIIPEIEMPGHSQAAIAAYPELGCTSTNSATNKKIEVATKWGVFEEVYCPKESTFQFLEDVIDEVIELFPGKYIHIGGDEAPKTRWKNCNHCQKLIKKENLKDEHGLQSYFIRRMEKYINSKGKQIIGWDEILEGGLAPNATVMSWRGTKAAVEAAKQNHYVILTPTSHSYFDYYQSENENEPIAIGGFLPLEKVYSFNPIPKELNKEESKYVLGAQGNVWTEYMPTSHQVEYMAFPRAIALSEVLWSSKENRNYKDFIKRLEHYQKRLDKLNVNYANHIYEVQGELKNVDGRLTYELSSVSDTYDIFYSINGENPDELYKKPIPIDSTVTIKARVLEAGMIEKGNLFQQKINLHKGVSAKISINKEPHLAYNAGGKEALINGISGNNKRFGDKEWLGFWGEDVEITIEFDTPTEISSISTRFHNGNGQWIYAPKEIGFSFKLEEKGTINNINQIKNREQLLVNHKYSMEPTYVNKIEIIVKNYGIIPEGKQGAGNKAWTFIDEIIIE